jgi:hypothetical protein
LARAHRHGRRLSACRREIDHCPFGQARLYLPVLVSVCFVSTGHANVTGVDLILAMAAP